MCCVLAAEPWALATETDQFTTPKEPLQDIGPALSRKVAEILESDRTGRNPEVVLADWAGRSLLSSRLARWVGEIPETGGPVRFRPGAFGSIYRAAFSPVPATFLFDSPTVNLHGHYMGTDKIDHFFRQGYEYFALAMEKQAHGFSAAAAIAAAVELGVRQEHRQLGTLASGVYSNADLAANYAGMKFYLNLRQPVRIGNRVWPALLEQTAEGWRFRADAEPFLDRFLSDHLDESLNPSRYRFSRGSIRASIQARCARWIPFYADRIHLVAPSGRGFAGDWFGEDYGHWLPPEEEVSIATECSAHG